MEARLRPSGSAMSDLRACPFCGGKVVPVEPGEMPPDGFYIGRVNHAKSCILMTFFDDDPDAGTLIWLQQKDVAAWNKRTPDYEVKWAELVETIATRTDQRKVTP